MLSGLPYKNIESLIQAVRLTKTRLKAVGKESQLFASCFTVDTLIEKLELKTQTSCCHYLAEWPGKIPHEVFEAWLGMEGRAAMVQRQSTLAAQYQQRNGQKVQQLLPRAQGLHGNDAATKGRH